MSSKKLASLAVKLGSLGFPNIRGRWVDAVHQGKRQELIDCEEQAARLRAVLGSREQFGRAMRYLETSEVSMAVLIGACRRGWTFDGSSSPVEPTPSLLAANRREWETMSSFGDDVEPTILSLFADGTEVTGAWGRPVEPTPSLLAAKKPKKPKKPPKRPKTSTNPTWAS